jgi:hypothetical protein
MTELEQLEALSGKARAQVILATVRGLIRDEQRLTTAAVDAQCFTLHGWTETDNDELAAAQAVIDAEADAHVAKLETEAAEKPEVLSSDNTLTEAEPQGEQPPTLDHDAALAELNAASRALADARTAVTVASHKRGKARTALASALEAWTQQRPTQSFVQALREVVQTQQATRKQRQEATIPGPSAWDRQAYYSAGRGSAPAFVQSRMRNGGNRRGSLPLSRLRGKLDIGGKMPMPKLPSER